MKPIVKAMIVGLVLALPATASHAIPNNISPGQTYCNCTCDAAGAPSAEYEWAMTGTCNSNGKKCTRQGKAGKLRDCNTCKSTGGSSQWEYICTPVAAISRAPGVTLQPAQPAQPAAPAAEPAPQAPAEKKPK